MPVLRRREGELVRSLRPSALVRSFLIWLEVPHKHVVWIARAVSHVEHAGGTVVGIEFLFPHYFAAVHLLMLAVCFLVLRVLSGAEA